MRYIISCFLILIITTSCVKINPTFDNSQISLIPKPSKFTLGEESFLFNSNTAISIDDESQNMAVDFLKNMIKTAAGFDLKISKTNAEIKFQKIQGLNPEAYQLNISPKSIIIKASDAAGYFYAVQTLRQLLPIDIENKTSTNKKWLVPSVSIEDEPRFKWRGMQMDFSRHFFDIDEVKTFLDYMALYKMNTYHMHLTDDQGWRVEIKKYPLLTEKGAWRFENEQDKQCNELAKTNPMFIIDKKHYKNKPDGKKYGGFFTQEQLKEIINYASDRNIEIIPEIDMPGHFKSAIDNYPYLSCKADAGWGEHFSVPACLGKKTSYDFTKDILSEIADLFPSKYVHIGGDEVNIKSWKECPNCQKTIKKNKLKNEHELQSFFNKEIEKFLQSKGKKLIGWDEIVEGGLSKDATMMWWRNWAPKARYIAANNGNDMIITPDFEYYFDFTNEATPISKVYNYEPVPSNFTKEQAKHVLGIQANLWAERIPNFKRLQYQAFPRLLALSESGWTSKKDKNFDDFQARLDLQYDRLDALKINYFIPSVKGLADRIGFIDTTTITLEAPLENMEIYYTLDGKTPSRKSLKYTSPIKISKNTTIHTIAYRGKIASDIKSAIIEKQTYLEATTIQPTIGSLQQWTAIKKFNIVEAIKLPKNAKWKITNNINLQGFEDEDNLSIIFKGYFKADEDGIYEFITKSDDGSLLFINNKLVVNNGGNHAAITRTGMVALKKGWHALTINFHEATGGSELNVWFKTPNKEKQLLKGQNIGY